MRIGTYLPLVCLAFSSCKTEPAEVEASRPNILFIMSDDHAYQAPKEQGLRIGADLRLVENQCFRLHTIQILCNFDVIRRE